MAKAKPLSHKKAMSILKEMERWYRDHEEEYRDAAKRYTAKPMAGVTPEVNQKAVIDTFEAGANGFCVKKEALQYAINELRRM